MWKRDRDKKRKGKEKYREEERGRNKSKGLKKDFPMVKKKITQSLSKCKERNTN